MCYRLRHVLNGQVAGLSAAGLRGLLRRFFFAGAFVAEAWVSTGLALGEDGLPSPDELCTGFRPLFWLPREAVAEHELERLPCCELLLRDPPVPGFLP